MCNQARAKLPVPPVMTKVFPLKASVIVFIVFLQLFMIIDPAFELEVMLIHAERDPVLAFITANMELF